MRLLLDHGATIDVFQAAALGDVERLRALLDEDPQRVNARDAQHRTPLYEAAHNLHLEAVELLLARGADLEARTSGGETRSPRRSRTPGTPGGRRSSRACGRRAPRSACATPCAWASWGGCRSS